MSPTDDIEVPLTDVAKQRLERLKIHVDTTKHFTTLASGTIVIIAGFMDKFPKPLREARLLNSSIGLMIGCVAICCVFLWFNALISLAMPIPRTSKRFEEALPEDFRQQQWNIVLFAAIVISFLLGICCLALFAVRNIKALK